VTAPSVRSLFVATHLVRGGQAADDGGLAWFHTGAPHEELGGVLLARPDRIDEAVDALAGRPALWHSWPGSADADIEDDLLGRGFRFVEEEPVMVLDLHALGRTPAAPSGLELREVDDHAGLASWVRVWSGTEPDPAIVTALATAGLGTGRSVHHLIATLDGAPVGCSAAVAAGGAVAVEHVVTDARHRGRGIGTALTSAALRTGLAAGARHAVLSASPDGAGLYRRLGFVQRDTVRRFAAAAE